MNAILQQIQYHAAVLPLSLQAELLNYAVYLEQKTQKNTTVVSTQARRDRLAVALVQAVALNPFAAVVDPIAWQRELRHDRSLPGIEPIAP